jgi:ABC-type transport system involved in multi-copper enzyme maturation permease subunit
MNARAQTMQLVEEKEARLRAMVRLHGLGGAAYGGVQYAWYFMLYVTYMALFVGFGSAIGLSIFTRNHYGLQAAFYLLYGNTLVALAFLLSCFFTSARTAVAFCFLAVFGSGLVGDLLLKPYIESGSAIVWVFELLPPFSLYRGLYELMSYAELAANRRTGTGMTPASLEDPGNGMAGVWRNLAVQWALALAVAWYLEQARCAAPRQLASTCVRVLAPLNLN